MLDSTFYVPFWFEFTATVVYAISGALSASRARYDILGTVVMATIVGLFGGVMRDILLQDYGIYAFQRPSLMIGCIICGVVVFYFGRLVAYLDPVGDIIDTVSVGLWAIVGTSKALYAGLGVIPAVIMGFLTASGGGIVRDVLMNERISAFQPGSYYGIAVVVGSVAFAFMRTNHILDQWSAVICALLTIGIRLCSVVFGWRTKPSYDLTVPMADALAKPVRALKGRDRTAAPTDKAKSKEKPGSSFESHPHTGRSFNKRRGKNSSKIRHRFRQ